MSHFHTHYALKEQREQLEKQDREKGKGKSKGKGVTVRQKQIQERTQEYQELHKLIETKRVNTTPTTRTTKYERSSCRIGDISGFVESEHVLESRTVAKDREIAQRMKEQLDDMGQSTDSRATSSTTRPLPKIHNCDENTCPYCFEDFVGRDDVLRTQCRHVFHTACYTQMQDEGVNTCPACDGNITATHRWYFITKQTIPQTTPAPHTTTKQATPQTTPDPHTITRHKTYNMAERDTPEDDTFFDSLTATPTKQKGTDTESKLLDSLPTTQVPLFPTTNTISRPGTAPLPKQCYPIYAPQQTGIGLSVPGIEGTEPAIRSDAYISNTELHDGQHALLVDPGSCNNLTGGEWVRRGARLANQAGKTGIKSTKRENPLHVSGVGTNSQECHYDTQLPLTLRDIYGNPVECTYTAPTVNNSSLPALLGLNSLINVGALMDFRNMHIHFTGPGPLNYTAHLPEGTQTFDLHQAPSGHVMIPCCKYATPQEQQRLRQRNADTETLTLLASQNASDETPRVIPWEETITNPWNRFQQRYSGYNLRQKELPVFYKWEQRSDLEKTCTDAEVVEQFIAFHRDGVILVPSSATSSSQ